MTSPAPECPGRPKIAKSDASGLVHGGLHPGTRWSARIELPGEPATQGSKRAIVPAKTGKAVLIEANARLRPWQAELRAAMLEVAPPEPLPGAVKVFLRVGVVRPRSHYGTGRNAQLLKPGAPLWPPTGKDLDKIQRAIGDTGSGILWRDDRQIAAWEVRRQYDERPGIILSVLELR
jgi:Holliday junction resolvase RusA-like endonuclease